MYAVAKDQTVTSLLTCKSRRYKGPSRTSVSQATYQSVSQCRAFGNRRMLARQRQHRATATLRSFAAQNSDNLLPPEKWPIDRRSQLDHNECITLVYSTQQLLWTCQRTTVYESVVRGRDSLTLLE
jgi:hypothetical protein